METDGGGWTLVYSYTFLRPMQASTRKNTLTPRPNWQVSSQLGTFSKLSTTPPLGENDYNAMDFAVWKVIGQEVLAKSNLNEWFSCTPRSGSLVTWTSGSLDCHLVKSISSRCPGNVPDAINTKWTCGPAFTKGEVKNKIVIIHLHIISIIIVIITIFVVVVIIFIVVISIIRFCLPSLISSPLLFVPSSASRLVSHLNLTPLHHHDHDHDHHDDDHHLGSMVHHQSPHLHHQCLNFLFQQ